METVPDAEIYTLRLRAQEIAHARGVPLADDGHPGDHAWRLAADYLLDIQERKIRLRKMHESAPKKTQVGCC